MANLILSIVAAALVAIPTIWAWKVSSDKKKAVKELEKRKNDIRKAVTSGDIKKVQDELAKWV